MTKKERMEAISIMKRYQKINERIERVLESLEKINNKKEAAMNELEEIKKAELEFMAAYEGKYGRGRNILMDLQNSEL